MNLPGGEDGIRLTLSSAGGIFALTRALSAAIIQRTGRGVFCAAQMI